MSTMDKTDSQDAQASLPLDQKLFQILQGNPYQEDLKEVVKLIDQAYQEAYYLHPKPSAKPEQSGSHDLVTKESEGVTIRVGEAPAMTATGAIEFKEKANWSAVKTVTIADEEFMTGEEWYQRCLQLIEETLMVGDPKTCARMIIAKAAGLDAQGKAS